MKDVGNVITTSLSSTAAVNPSPEKVKVYLQMILDRLHIHSDTWSSFVEKNSEYSVKILELEYYSQNLFTHLHNSETLNLKMIWKSLSLILDPLWDISEDIFRMFGELDSLYSELVLLSAEKKIDSQINKLNELKNRQYIRIRGSESIQAGRSLIASLKEHCSRIFTLKDSQDFKIDIITAITEILEQSKQNLFLSKSWISGAFSCIEMMKFKAEDALEDLLKNTEC